ncbi:hypothetical protein BKA58DRAFT_391764 [Alternaria rosae]|uniref:uncharacterized protein n=1 Tax=Alternaria rosae TaxID=1187941 RepID=UPI001E8D6068|nr:uncharacterized protein BKA58DRAFT_391764 [Alternaria rosae]KAH6865303.1 hypothetical protein BKA58DRAFT_391764 [Alternaria rosae]
MPKILIFSHLSICLVRSFIPPAHDIKARKETPNNRNLHQPPARQAHETFLPSKPFSSIDLSLPYPILPFSPHRLLPSTHISGVCITPAL